MNALFNIDTPLKMYIVNLDKLLVHMCLVGSKILNRGERAAGNCRMEVM